MSRSDVCRPSVPHSKRADRAACAASTRPWPNDLGASWSSWNEVQRAGPPVDHDALPPVVVGECDLRLVVAEEHRLEGIFCQVRREPGGRRGRRVRDAGEVPLTRHLGAAASGGRTDSPAVAPEENSIVPYLRASGCRARCNIRHHNRVQPTEGIHGRLYMTLSFLGSRLESPVRDRVPGLE